MKRFLFCILTRDAAGYFGSAFAAGTAASLRARGYAWHATPLTPALLSRCEAGGVTLSGLLFSRP